MQGKSRRSGRYVRQMDSNVRENVKEIAFDECLLSPALYNLSNFSAMRCTIDAFCILGAYGRHLLTLAHGPA